MQNKQIELWIGWLLLIGTLLSLIIVVIGGGLYLFQAGSEPLAQLHIDATQQTIKEVWQVAFSFTPLGIIQLGLLLLVATQSLRVALLCFYYIRIRDHIFTGICGFILFVLIYSTFCRT